MCTYYGTLCQEKGGRDVGDIYKSIKKVSRKGAKSRRKKKRNIEKRIQERGKRKEEREERREVGSPGSGVRGERSDDGGRI